MCFGSGGQFGQVGGQLPLLRGSLRQNSQRQPIFDLAHDVQGE